MPDTPPPTTPTSPNYHEPRSDIPTTGNTKDAKPNPTDTSPQPEPQPTTQGDPTNTSHATPSGNTYPTTAPQQTQPRLPHANNDDHQHSGDSDDPPERHGDGAPPGAPETALPTPTTAHEQVLKFAAWNIGGSKLIDAVDAMNTINKYDCVAITQLPVFDCKHQELKTNHYVIQAEGPRCTRSGYAALAMPKKLWAKLTKTCLTQYIAAALTMMGAVPIVVVAVCLPPRLDRDGVETTVAGLEGWLNGQPQDVAVIVGGDYSAELTSEAIAEARRGARATGSRAAAIMLP